MKASLRWLSVFSLFQEEQRNMKVLIVFYSTFLDLIYKMAEAVAEGVKEVRS